MALGWVDVKTIRPAIVVALARTNLKSARLLLEFRLAGSRSTCSLSVSGA
jgi:hypothetical protein